MSDFRSFRASAVVLRHADWGEADRLLTLYTREQGMVRALAKGVRKMTSRKAGHLQPFTHVTVQLAKGRDLLIVTQADTVNAFLSLHDNLEKTSYAAYVIELLLRFSYEEEAGNPTVFKLLTETLDRLEKARAERTKSDELNRRLVVNSNGRWSLTLLEERSTDVSGNEFAWYAHLSVRKDGRYTLSLQQEVSKPPAWRVRGLVGFRNGSAL